MTWDSENSLPNILGSEYYPLIFRWNPCHSPFPKLAEQDNSPVQTNLHLLDCNQNKPAVLCGQRK